MKLNEQPLIQHRMTNALSSERCEAMSLALQPCVGLTDSVPFDPQAISQFFEQAFGQMAPAIIQQGAAIDGPPFSVYTAYSEQGMTVRACLPVAPAISVEAPLTYHPARTVQAVGTLHRGPYEALQATYDRLDAYLKEQQKGPAAVAEAVEIYYTDPGQEPDSSQWETGVFYVLQS
jgi:effector-binding domain-containing protein